MGEIAIEGFSDKPDGASTTSSRDKNLSDYERRYDKGTYKPLPEVIRHEPLNYIPEDYDFQLDKPKKEDDIMINTNEEEEKKVKTPNRISNFIGKRGIVRNAFGIKEFGQRGILGKLKSRVMGQPTSEGQGTNKPEMPKPFGGKFLDGSLKEALVTWVFSKSGVGITQSPESKEQQDKSRRDKRELTDKIALSDHKEKFDDGKNISISW